MRIGPARSNVYAPGTANAVHGIEKARAANGLTGKGHGREAAHTVKFAGGGGKTLSFSGTDAREQGPIIGPSTGFAAQVIGQVLESKKAFAAEAAHAYAKRTPAPASQFIGFA